MTAIVGVSTNAAFVQSLRNDVGMAKRARTNKADAEEMGKKIKNMFHSDSTKKKYKGEAKKWKEILFNFYPSLCDENMNAKVELTYEVFETCMGALSVKADGKLKTPSTLRGVLGGICDYYKSINLPINIAMKADMDAYYTGHQQTYTSVNQGIH